MTQYVVCWDENTDLSLLLRVVDFQAERVGYFDSEGRAEEFAKWLKAEEDENAQVLASLSDTLERLADKCGAEDDLGDGAYRGGYEAGVNAVRTRLNHSGLGGALADAICDQVLRELDDEDAQPEPAAEDEGSLIRAEPGGPAEYR